jgi:oxygen-independent coproporphyrinogen III oxidase
MPRQVRVDCTPAAWGARETTVAVAVSNGWRAKRCRVYWWQQCCVTNKSQTVLPFNAELLQRYDTPGPRYTSYPTAPQFRNDFGAAELALHAGRSNEQSIARRLSLYMHVPYCFSPCFYCGCNRVITRDFAKGKVYVERLVRELELVATLFDPHRELIQLHMGGGTPNFLSPTEIATLLDGARRRFRFSEAANRDFSIELDPRFVNAGDVAAYAALGFNRASLGVQDFDPDVQRAVNRAQSVVQTELVVADCRAAGMRSVNIDLIYGLPKQTLAGFGRTLQTVLAMRPDRVATYGYAHLPDMFKAQRQIDSRELPNPETRLALLQLAIQELSAAGYLYIGMDHFALPTDDLAVAQAEGWLHRNFMGYTTHADTDLIGVGVSAISHIGDSFSQNPRDLPTWEASIDADQLPVWRGMAMSADDVIRAQVIQQIMCRGQIVIDAVERAHNIDFSSYFADALKQLRPLMRDGLVVVAGKRIKATPRGRLLLRRIAMCFDSYLAKSAALVGEPNESVAASASSGSTPRYAAAV